MAENHMLDHGVVGSLTLSPEEQRVVRTLVSALRRIRYGSVQIVVQDSRVVQIDTLEKQRISHMENE